MGLPFFRVLLGNPPPQKKNPEAAMSRNRHRPVFRSREAWPSTQAYDHYRMIGFPNMDGLWGLISQRYASSTEHFFDGIMGVWSILGYGVRLGRCGLGAFPDAMDREE